MLGVRTPSQSKNKSSKNSSKISNFKKSLRLTLDEDPPESKSRSNAKDLLDSSSPTPSQNDTDYFDTTNEVSELSSEIKRSNVGPESAPKTRNRLTFGPKAYPYSRKNTDLDAKGKGARGAGAGEGSILSFKNFAVPSRAESIRNSHKKQKQKRERDRRAQIEVTSSSLLSENSAKDAMNLVSSENLQELRPARKSIEKYSVYKEVMGKKDSFQKRNSVVHSVGSDDLEEPRLTSSLIQNAKRESLKVQRRRRKAKKFKQKA